jgi:hypothetical protein
MRLRKQRREKSVGQRFLGKIRWTESWCPWLWIGNRDKRGYGHLCVRHSVTGEWVTGQAHRIAYQLYVGPIPEGMDVLHSCDNPNCVWPSHLHLGTKSDNLQEAYDRGLKTAVGEANGQAKLTEQDVVNIRASDHSHSILAEQYGVRPNTISRVRSGKRWSHVP